MATEDFTVGLERTATIQNTIWQGRRTLFEENSRLWMVATLIVTDLVSLVLAILAALQVHRLVGAFRLDVSHIELFLLLAGTLVVLFARKGLYPAVGLNYVDELQQIVSSASFAFMVMLGITFMLKTTSNYSRLILLVTWVLSLAVIPGSRYVIRRLMIRMKLWGEPVVIIGGSQKAHGFAEHFKVNLQLGLRPVALLRADECTSCVRSVHTPDSICTIKAQARGLSLSTALVVIDDLNNIDRLVEQFRTIFHRVILIKDQNGRYGLNGLEALDFSSVLGLQVRNNLLNPWSQALKRLVDMLGSFLGLAMLSPALGLIALCIKLDSPGEVFYRQERLGRDGKPFNLLKFRTMHQDAERILVHELARSPALKAEWDSYQKLRHDPRITRVGRLLRKFSLDELPQLWNIARAEMSLVGPRPMMTDQREMYGESFGNYVQVTPGMTGLWQVSGRNQTTFAQRAELDNEYIQRWSLWLDVYILFKTIKVVLWRDGAY